MVTPEEVTDPYLEALIPVPPASEGVCHVCHSAADPGATMCSSCFWNDRTLSRPTPIVVPISLTPKSGQLYYALRHYKSGWSDEVRQRFSLHLAAFCVRFLTVHEQCIAEKLGGVWDAVTIVPSTSGRAPPHPLEGVLKKSRRLGGEFLDLLETGTYPLGHNQAGDTGFALRTGADVDGMRILVIDDTFTSGARAQSAASRLLLEGAAGVAIVAIGRIFDPTYSDATRALWERIGKQRYSFDTCCFCA